MIFIIGILCFTIGFIVGGIAILNNRKDYIKNGLMEHDGVIYTIKKAELKESN